MKTILTTIALLLTTSLAYSKPVILFSDLTAAPNTGWDTTNPTKGAVVTIWGFGFGQQRLNNFVSVSGVSLDNDLDYLDVWGKINNPVPNLQTLTFQLNNTIPQGEGGISVTVNGTQSNQVDFNVNDGRIFFTDVNSATDGTGTLQDPWKTPNSFLIQRELGDILYFRQGTYDEIYFGGKANFWMRSGPSTNVPPRDATRLKPISFVGFPNEVAIIDSETFGNSQFKTSFRIDAAHHTVAKLRIKAYSSGVNTTSDSARVVGNNLTGLQVLVDGAGMISLGGNNAKALGNSVHGARSNDKLDHGVYISGCAPDVGMEVAWNHIFDLDIEQGPYIVINHQGNRCPSSVFVKTHRVHHNIVDCSAYPSRGIGIYDLSWDPQEGETNEPEAPMIYNNLVYSCGHAGTNYNSPSVYQSAAHGIWFNNMIMQSTQQAISIGGTERFISTQVFNNIIELSDPTKPYISNEVTGFNINNNMYYGAGDYPGNDPNAINSDPKITVDTNSWVLTIDPSSQSIDNGIDVTALDIGPRDLNGNERIANNIVDIGAIEYVRFMIFSSGFE